MDNRQPQPQSPRRRADTRTIAISIAGIVVLLVCFVVVLTQDDPTTRTIAILTTVALWFFLRFSRRTRS